jgi:ribonuclease HI
MAWAFIVRSIGKEKGEIYRASGISGRGPETTNNISEYLAVIAAILWLLKMPEEKRQPVIIQSDSQLIVKQCSGVWDCKDEELRKLHKLVLAGVNRFGKSITFKWIPRDKNAEADELSRNPYNNNEVQEEIKAIHEHKFEENYKDDDLSW